MDKESTVMLSTDDLNQIAYETIKKMAYTNNLEVGTAKGIVVFTEAVKEVIRVKNEQKKNN